MRMLFVVLIGVHFASVSGAQDTPQPAQFAARGPRFVYQTRDGGAPVLDARDAEPLRRKVTLALDSVPLNTALDDIASQTGLQFAYVDEIPAMHRRLSLHVSNVSVEGALFELLLDSDLDVRVGSNGLLSLVPRTSSAANTRRGSDSATIQGVITDAATRAPLAQVVVRIDRSGRSVITREDGTYIIKHLSRGPVSLEARRLGYAPVSRTIQINADSTFRLDFALPESPAQLDQVVTTVTGDQSRGSVGNSIALINADSLIRETPIANFGDLVNARAAGVQVINPGGLTGASPPIYIRGASSLNLSTQPLLYVDGVRVSNSSAATSGVTTGYGTGLFSGRLDDISPDEIQSVEIVRGPSAATLYGTDAANGVIVVTTKRGVAGPPRWSAHVEGGALTADPSMFPYNYSGWGHSPQNQVLSSCTLLALQSAACVQDSVTKFNPIRVPSLTPLGTGNQSEGGLQVSGGGQSLRYFASGDYTSELGYLKMPVADQHILDSLVGPTAQSAAYRRPNAVTKYDARANVVAPLARDADLSISAGYVSNNARIPNENLTYAAGGGNGFDDPSAGWLFGNRPVTVLSQQNTESNRHFTGAMSAQWFPTSWLSARATGGVDLSSDDYLTFAPAAVAPVNFLGGTIAEANGTTDLYSIDIGTTARLPVQRWLTSSTSIGAQYHLTSNHVSTASASNLSPGGTSVSAGIPSGLQADSQSVVAGVYAEEQLAFDERFFVVGAVRVDGANDFGSHYNSAVYPKGSASWVISREGFFPRTSLINTLRLRAAYGESGTQPGEILTTLRTQAVGVDGTIVPGLSLQQLGNPNVQPERQREFETGADIDLASQRIHAEFTYYSKRNTNALYAVPLGASVGGGTLLENVGTILNWGYEGLLSAELLSARPLSWDVAFNGSVNHNQVLRLGPNFQPVYGLYGVPSIVAGYPIYSFFAQPYTFSDANHDGIIDPTELTVASQQRYYGQSIPPLQLTVATHIGLFENIRLGALFDYRGGFLIPNQYLGDQCLTGTAFASVSRHASLGAQAACVAYADTPTNDNRGLLTNGSFWRFRELSITLMAPRTLAGALRVSSASFTLAARNLALWTRFSGGDPETPNQLGTPADGVFQTGGGIPAAQYWLARFNVTF
jgi:TonB-linked SusC/RagA family outer membrane protein